MLDLLAAFLPACSINAARVGANADAACVTVTELADSLVRRDGLSFRQAHEIAAATARAVIAEGKPLAKGYPAFAAAYQAETGRAPSHTSESYGEAVSPEGFVASRERPGGPGPGALATALTAFRARHAALAESRDTHLARIAAADAARAAAFAALTTE